MFLERLGCRGRRGRHDRFWWSHMFSSFSPQRVSAEDAPPGHDHWSHREVHQCGQSDEKIAGSGSGRTHSCKYSSIKQNIWIAIFTWGRALQQFWVGNSSSLTQCLLPGQCPGLCLCILQPEIGSMQSEHLLNFYCVPVSHPPRVVDCNNLLSP